MPGNTANTTANTTPNTAPGNANTDTLIQALIVHVDELIIETKQLASQLDKIETMAAAATHRHTPIRGNLSIPRRRKPTE
jgi:hypothetical protein